MDLRVLFYRKFVVGQGRERSIAREFLEKNEKKQEKNVDLSHILFLLFIFCFCNLFPTDILP